MFTIIAKSIVQCHCLEPSPKDDAAMVESAKRLDMMVGIFLMVIATAALINGGEHIAIPLFISGSFGCFLAVDRILDRLIEEKTKTYARSKAGLSNV